ncbi:MAG: hypothetical protein ACR2GH_22930 [Pseudonocardia sp.]
MTMPANRSAERVWGTPRTIFLGQLGRGRAEREWICYQAETADLQVARAQAAAQRDVARSRVTAVQEQLKSLGEQLPEGRPAVAAGEENADESVRAGRRQREHTTRQQALQAEIQEGRNATEEAEVEFARLDEQIRIRREVAEIQVAMIEAYVRRRCSAYLTRLVRKHPDSERIGSLLRSGWTEQPSWLGHPSVAHSGGA